MNKDDVHFIKNKLLDRTNKLIRQLQYHEDNWNSKPLNNLDLTIMANDIKVVLTELEIRSSE